MQFDDSSMHPHSGYMLNGIESLHESRSIYGFLHDMPFDVELLLPTSASSITIKSGRSLVERD